MYNATNKDRLISRYLNGNFTQKDEKELLEWISESSNNKKKFFEIKDLWDAEVKPSFNGTEQLLQFYKKQALRKRNIKIPLWISGVAVAAILVVGFIIGSLLTKNYYPVHGQSESFYVPMGSKSQLTLSDGTKVSLNSQSRLFLCDNFSEINRTVSLSGEGYFEVKSDKKHPFIVKTNNFEVRVTGTKFNVSSYSDDENISATLSEGHIQLYTKNNQEFILKSGDKISFNKKTMESSLQRADIEAELSWVNGEFIFKEIPFSNLIKKLERWYDVKLLYKGLQFNAMKYSGRFKNQETIWQVLDALKLTTPIDYKRINFREFNLIYKPM